MTFSFDNTYAHLPDEFFRKALPTPVRAPQLIAFNEQLADNLGIDHENFNVEKLLKVLAGNAIASGSKPIAMAYSGHQFAGFSPQLGDGRAILLGEVIDRKGVRRDIQLKGAGPTPFSRRGDGRSALGPVLREYIVSEAMTALGVPTTRALAAVASGEHVIREGPTTGGVFTRVASSHIRVGTFQWFAARQDTENLKVLADYVIDRHYPHVADENNPYQALLQNVIDRQADLIAHWMQLGFIHGVMNTDNMTVSGETIDYGPCAFLDNFHPMKKFSSIDQQGRYAFANQSPIGLWNLSRFAETLLPLLDDDEDSAVELAKTALDTYTDRHGDALRRRFTAKIGISDPTDDAWDLSQELLTAMGNGEADFTLVFRHLSTALESDDDATLVSLFSTPGDITQWLKQWRALLQDTEQQQAVALMRSSNPIFIPRNHRIEQAIQAGYEGNFEPFHQLNAVLKQPWTEQPQHAEFELAPAPEEVVCATFCGT